jgi:hypothetical protein
LQGNRWADGFGSCWDSRRERQLWRSDIFVESGDGNEFKLRQERHGGRLKRLCRPDGAGELDGAGGYKDFAPDGAAERGSATRSSFDGSEAFGLFDDVDRGDVLRLTEPRSNRNAAAAFSPALEVRTTMDRKSQCVAQWVLLKISHEQSTN